jgi:predicted transposase YbfD/YdcC
VLAQVKENQKQLLDDCRVMARHDAPVDTFAATPEKAHGRMETRAIRVFDCTYTTDPGWQPLITQIVEAHRIREVFNTRKKCWERAEETAFYISTTRRSAEEYNAVIRGHWGIENRNHRVRDGTLREDASRIRNNPGIMARCRSFTLNILRANDVTNIAQALYENAISFKKLRQLAYLWP